MRDTQALLPRVLAAMGQPTRLPSTRAEQRDLTATVRQLRDLAALCEEARARLLEAAALLGTFAEGPFPPVAGRSTPSSV